MGHKFPYIGNINILYWTAAFIYIMCSIWLPLFWIHILMLVFHCWWTRISTVEVMLVMALTMRSLRWFIYVPYLYLIHHGLQVPPKDRNQGVRDRRIWEATPTNPSLRKLIIQIPKNIHCTFSYVWKLMATLYNIITLSNGEFIINQIRNEAFDGFDM